MERTGRSEQFVFTLPPLSSFLWPIFALSFFSFAGFVLFDFLALKRPFQIFSFGFTFFIGSLLIVAKRPSPMVFSFGSLCYTIYLIAGCFHSFFIQKLSFLTLTYVVILFAMLMLSRLGIFAVKRLSGWVLFYVFLFACMGFAEFTFLMLHPEVIPLTSADPNALYLTDQINYLHPINFLGYSTGLESAKSFLGITVTRMRSFMFEPSLVVAYFLLPAGFAFLFQSRFFYFVGFIAFAFSLLTLSGSAFLSIFMGLIPLAVYRWTHMRVFFLLIPLIQVLFFLSMNLFGLTEDVIYLINIPGELIKEYTGVDIFIKTTSAVARLNMFKEATDLILKYPTGQPFASTLSVGTFWLSYLMNTPVGFICNLFMMLWIFNRIGYGFLLEFSKRKKNYFRVLGLSLIYGVLYFSFSFSSYGFTTGFGLIWIYLVISMVSHGKFFAKD